LFPVLRQYELAGSRACAQRLCRLPDRDDGRKFVLKRTARARGGASVTAIAGRGAVSPLRKQTINHVSGMRSDHELTAHIDLLGRARVGLRCVAQIVTKLKPFPDPSKPLRIVPASANRLVD